MLTKKQPIQRQEKINVATVSATLPRPHPNNIRISIEQSYEKALHQQELIGLLINISIFHLYYSTLLDISLSILVISISSVINYLFHVYSYRYYFVAKVVFKFVWVIDWWQIN